MLVISREEVRSLVPVEDAIGLVEDAYIELSKRTAKVPDRISVSSRGENGTTLIMPGYLGTADSVAVKLVSVFPANAEIGLPAIHAVVIVFDPETGRPMAMIEGGYLTALRTGASCGVATRLLARSDAKTLAMIGAGAQSRLVIPSVCAVRKIEKVFVFDISTGACSLLVEEMSERFKSEIVFVSVADSDDAIRDADVICTATTSATPVIDGSKLRTGVHINGIGSFNPEMNEVGFETIRKCSRLVVDSLDGALAEAGDLIQAIQNGVIESGTIHGEIGEILAGSKSGRESDSEITLFKSVGNAALDVAVAAVVYERATAAGIGTNVDLFRPAT